MTSPGKYPWRIALALFIGCWATAASPCSVSRVLDAPFGSDTYGFYGEVVGHVAMRIPGCETVPGPPDRCAPSWGLRIRILEPLNLPARNLAEVEYFNFDTGSDCRALPVPQDPGAESSTRWGHASHWRRACSPGMSRGRRGSA